MHYNAMAGKRFIPLEVSQQLNGFFPEVALTPREVEVLSLVARGFGNKEVGDVLGTASGILFGVSDIAIKAITGMIGDAGVLAGFLSPWMLTAVIASVAAFYASARGLQDGEAVPVIAVTGTAANVAGIAGGIIVFGDPMPADPIGIVVQVAAFAMVCVAAALTPAPVRAVGRARA